MGFEWNSGKRTANLLKHGLAFEDAALVFEGVVLTALDTRRDYGETGYQSLGMLRGRMVLIAHTQRKDRIRIISMRKANEREKKIYQKRFETP